MRGPRFSFQATGALVCIAVLGATGALAQNRGFRLDRYDGTAAGSASFLVERPWYSETRAFAVSLTFDGASQPLVPKVATFGGDLVPIISLNAVGHLELAYAPFSRLLVRADVPVSLFEQGTAELLSGVAPLKTASVGDPRAGAFVRLFGRPQRDHFSLHVGADVWVPIGAQVRHQGDSGVRLLGHAIASGVFGPGRYSLDLGFLFRPYASFGPPALGLVSASEARAGLFVGMSVLNGRLTFGPEAQFSMQVIGVNALKRDGLSLEVLGGASWLIADQVLVGLAGGAGFFGAAGTPDARALVRIGWAPKKSPARTPTPTDTTPPPGATPYIQSDGALALATSAGAPTADAGSVPSTGSTGSTSPAMTAAVAAPAQDEGDAEEDEHDEAEKAREVEERARAEAQRRATADADGDGVPDVADRCPFEAETANGLRDGDGCPEVELEHDAPMARVLTAEAAAVAAAKPKASTAPEAGTAPTPNQGATAAVVVRPVDSDGDGVTDDVDRCPATAEDADGFEDEDGCPEPDNDDDRVADTADQCPDTAETLNGRDDQDGCPDTAVDTDRDGVADAVDRCPLEPETSNGVRDDDGCPESLTPVAAPVMAKLVAPRPLAPLTEEDGAPPSPSKGPKADAEPDTDKDGVPDSADRCPASAEDRDGFEDDDGCPEPDNDDDGIADVKDKCPNEAETYNGYKDQDGCPDETTDSDADGVAYDEDRCPLEAGDASDGCPHEPPPALVTKWVASTTAAATATHSTTVTANSSSSATPGAPEVANTDADHDGVPDDADACPTAAEDTDGFEDEDGCPEPDNDRDGVADAKDKCPLEAETINGVKDDDGCPDEGKPAVAIRGDKVVIDGVVRFKTGSATLERASLPLLQQVASTLKAAASLSVEIQGHTDDVGNAATNIKLSKRRAEAIRQVLVKAGVAPVRLVATGYGPTRPRASNKTAAGREQNRRVEFQILGESK